MASKKTLIAGSVGLVALGSIALAQTQKRRHASSETESPTGDTGTPAMEQGESVIEMPAAGETLHLDNLDPVIE